MAKNFDPRDGEFDWELYLSYGLKALLVFLALITLIRQEYVWFLGTLFSIYLTLMPAVLKRDYGVNLPIIFDLAITASITLHIIGGYVDLYGYIPWYDHVTHFLSSATISLIAVTALYILAFHTKYVNLPPVGFGIITVMFAMSMGVVWEFFEWGADIFTGTTLQHSIEDTMVDLLFNTIAGIIVAVIAVGRLKMGEFMTHGSVLEIGDVQNSVGYKRWQEIAKRDKRFGRNLTKAIRDPDMLERIMDRLVEDSHYITEKQVEMWNRLKDRVEESFD